MWWIPALAQGAAMLGKAIWGRPKTDKMTERRKLLGTLSGQGIPEEDIRKTVGGVSQEYATVEQKQSATIRGYLERAGLSGSVAGARALSEVQEPRKKAVSATRTQMELKSGEIERKATIDYANLVDNLTRQKQLEDTAFKRELIGGIAQTGASAAQGFQQSQALALKGQQVGAEVGYKGAMADYWTARTGKLDTKPLEEMTDMEFMQWAAESGNAEVLAKLLTTLGGR